MLHKTDNKQDAHSATLSVSKYKPKFSVNLPHRHDKYVNKNLELIVSQFKWKQIFSDYVIHRHAISHPLAYC